MRSINHPSRAHLTACGGIAVTLAALAIAGCGGGGHTSTAAAHRALGPATTAARTTAAQQDRPGAGAARVGKATSTHAHADGTRGAVKAPLPSASSSAARSAAKAASAGIAARRTQSHSSTTNHPSAKTHPSPPQIAAGVVLRTLSGTGNAALGKLTEKTATVLQWNGSGSPVEIFTAQGFRLVSSAASSGRVKLTPGEYRGVRIATKGPWTIELRAVE